MRRRSRSVPRGAQCRKATWAPYSNNCEECQDSDGRALPEVQAPSRSTGHTPRSPAVEQRAVCPVVWESPCILGAFSSPNGLIGPLGTFSILPGGRQCCPFFLPLGAAGRPHLQVSMLSTGLLWPRGGPGGAVFQHLVWEGSGGRVELKAA